MAQAVGSLTKPNFAERNANAFRHVCDFLEPEEVARTEAVCTKWRKAICTEEQQVWKNQCARYGDTNKPESGRYKERFSDIPDMAFGPRQWNECLKCKVGSRLPLPANIKSQVAKLGSTHTLTLIPKTINGQPLSFNNFAHIAKDRGMKLDIKDAVSKKYGDEAQDKALWVWMEKKVKPGSKGKTQAQTEQDYPKELGRALWITVSTVAHYARYKICLFSEKSNTLTRTRDAGSDGTGPWYVIVGLFTPDALNIVDYSHIEDDPSVGVAGCQDAAKI